MRVLVCGWFSFEGMGATAGDLRARDVVCGWLAQGRVPYDVAAATPFAPGVEWRHADPGAYSHVVFVCGPVGEGWPLTDLLERYRGCRLVGLDVSMLDPVERWNPFDLLLERDSSRTTRPDLAFLSDDDRVPVVGLVRAHRQAEYGDRGAHQDADLLIDRALAGREVAVVPIDTRLDVNGSGLGSALQVESLIARMDAVVTTRLHGLVLALKSGVPAVAVDPIRGGAKVTRQAAVIGWPHAFPVGADPADLRAALDDCLRPGAGARAAALARRARGLLAPVREEFIGEILGSATR